MTANARPDLRDCHPAVGRTAARRGDWQDNFRRAFRRWRGRRDERRAVALLTERDFHDMGRSRGELENELAKPFWRD